MYNKQTYADGASGGTAITAAKLNASEAGIQAAHVTADLSWLGRFNVRAAAYGAKGDGTTDDTAAVAAAAADQIAAGRGELYFPGGVYKVTALPSYSPPVAGGPLPFAVVGAGSQSTVIMHYGTTPGSSLTVSNPAFTPGSGSTRAPKWRGFTLDGTNSSGGASGLRWGDVSYGSFEDIQIKNFTTGDGWFWNNAYGWTEGIQMFACTSEYNAVQERFDCGSGRVLGTITTALTSGTAYTSIAVSGGVSEAMGSGQKFVIAAATSAPGVTTQTLQTTAAVTAGATSIPVASFTAAAAYPAGTAKVHFGGYGSFDYSSFHLYVQARANQHGLVFEQSRGIDQRVDRLGTVVRSTGNFQKGTPNTGIGLWIKGSQDTSNDTQWQLAWEVDGSGVAHKSIQLDTNSSTIGGTGHLGFFGFTACTMQKYQWSFSGTSYLAGLVATTDETSSPELRLRNIQQPFRRNIWGGNGLNGVRPVAGTGVGQYPGTTIANDTAWQNVTGNDVLVTLFVTIGSSAGPVYLGSENYSSMPSPSYPWGAASYPAGSVVQVGPFLHSAGEYVRIKAPTGSTFSDPFTHYA